MTLKPEDYQSVEDLWPTLCLSQIAARSPLQTSFIRSSAFREVTEFPYARSAAVRTIRSFNNMLSTSAGLGRGAHVRAFAHFGGVPRRCVDDNLSAAVRKVVFPRRQLTARFTALSSHSLFEPCFARPGEGHDKGGIESRGKGIRLQHLVPIPRARSLEACGELLHRRIEEQSATRRGRDDKRPVMERFAEEQSALRAIPEVEVDSRKVLPVSAGHTPRVRVEGAWYSVPSTWAGLDVIARVGVSKVELRCRGESVERDRQSFGGKDIRYRDDLPELGRKPQAVRQVAPELAQAVARWTLSPLCLVRRGTA